MESNQPEDSVGIIGIVYGGILKTRTSSRSMYLFASSNDIEYEFDKFADFYGPDVKICYVFCKNQDEMLQNFMRFNDSRFGSFLMRGQSLSEVALNLKTFVNANYYHTCPIGNERDADDFGSDYE